MVILRIVDILVSNRAPMAALINARIGMLVAMNCATRVLAVTMLEGTKPF